ncbi:ribosome maturation factor RimM [Caldimonas thermodepolymerans]|uniref:ribosome maturation factor RimM n=1 Tax=Caldimonas thermodepolymerans TaxID=215580 RepID=UPI0022355430|nr:ribosome maturation factor RimM [Caldimonas thermodepolymerans]UZG45546.1 ribosome maturation factor RimM [Caldimonas thermodepolymerans]
MAWPDDAVEVGRVIDAWGVKGWIKVQPYSADPQALFSSRRWFLQPPDSPNPRAAAAGLRWPLLLRITQARDHGDVIVAAAREVPDRTAAEALKGARVHVPRSSFPTADPEEYYWVDLIGLEVVNRQGERLGTVADLMDTGAHAILRVVDEAGGKPAERLIPFVGAYVDEVDQGARRITVDWGLDY